MGPSVMEVLMRLPVDPDVVPRWTVVESAIKSSLRFAAKHTGLPPGLLAAIALVSGFHLARRGVRFSVEVGIVFLVLVIASKVGIISW